MVCLAARLLCSSDAADVSCNSLLPGKPSWKSWPHPPFSVRICRAASPSPSEKRAGLLVMTPLLSLYFTVSLTVLYTACHISWWWTIPGRGRHIASRGPALRPATSVVVDQIHNKRMRRPCLNTLCTADLKILY